MEGSPVRLRADEQCEASGIPIPPGTYAGWEKAHASVNHPGGRMMRYRLDLINPEEENGAIVARGRDIDVTELVEQGKITVIRSGAF